MKEADSSKPKKTPRKWTPRQKAKMVLKARTRMAEGASFAQVCRELKLWAPTLREWMRKHPPKQAAFQEVAVEVPPPFQTISMTLPNGIRFEGLDICTAVSLAKRFK